MTDWILCPSANVCEALAEMVLHSFWQVTLICLPVAAVLRTSGTAKARAGWCALGMFMILICLPVTFSVVFQQTPNPRHQHQSAPSPQLASATEMSEVSVRPETAGTSDVGTT